MDYGRIKRSAEKRLKRWNAIHRYRREHKSGVEIRTHRGPSGYTAVACFRGSRKRQTTKHCGVGDARSPQSAIAKSLKMLARNTALRGRGR
jgi:hypothetical protein